MSIMVLAARQPERKEPGGGRVVQLKRAVCVILLSFFPLIFRICRGRVAAIPGTQIVVIPTTASQTPETSPALWWSSGSKLGTQVFLDHKDCSSVKKFMLHKKIRFAVVHRHQGPSLVWPFRGSSGSANPLLSYPQMYKKDTWIHTTMDPSGA